MKALKNLIALAFMALMAVLFSTLTGLPPAVWFGVLVLFSVIRKPAGSLFMAVTVEIWAKDIIDNLFIDNEFAKFAMSEDQYVIGGKIVHIPTAGAPSASKRNRTEFPVTAVKRADSEILYSLDTYYQDPKFVEKVEQYELSYEKRQSVAGEMEKQLIQDCMTGLLYRWSLKGTNMTTTGNYELTTGAATSEDILAGATGERKIFDKSVFGKIKKKMDNDNIPSAGRIALLTANHHQQFIDSLSDAAQTNFYRFADMQKGIIGMFLGFTVMMRSQVQRWRKTADVWAPVDELDEDFEAGTDDSAASLFYQKDCVSRARGEVNIFDNPGQAEYYGDVFSMNMRLGGRVRREKGVYSVVEDIVAP